MFNAPAFADRLREAMERAGMNSADLARACGVTPQAVHGWRTTGRVAKRHLIQIALVLNVPLTELLGPGEPPTAREPVTGAALRYALHAAYPDFSEADVSAVIGYADGLAAAVRRMPPRG